MDDPSESVTRATGGHGWWVDRLESLLTKLAGHHHGENFVRFHGSASDDANVLSRPGAEAAMSLLPSWGLGVDGRAIRRRLELDGQSEATALLATVHALVGGGWHPTRVRSVLRDNTLDLELGAPEIEGLPVWVVSLGMRLEELLRPPTSNELEPAPLGLIRDWIQERDPEWTYRPERGEIVGPFFFEDGHQAASFGCLVAGMAQLQRLVVQVAVEVDGDVVRVRLAAAGGGALTNGALVYSSVIEDLGKAQGAREPEGEVQLLAALTVGGREAERTQG